MNIKRSTFPSKKKSNASFKLVPSHARTHYNYCRPKLNKFTQLSPINVMYAAIMRWIKQASAPVGPIYIAQESHERSQGSKLRTRAFWVINHNLAHSWPNSFIAPKHDHILVLLLDMICINTFMPRIFLLVSGTRLLQLIKMSESWVGATCNI